MKMWNKLFAFFLLWNLLSLVFGQMDTEFMYRTLSRRIEDLSFDARLNVRTLDERIKTVETNVNQLMSAIQQSTENSESVVPGQEAFDDLKESIDFQALALWKLMTKEKTLLRESVKQLNKKIYELREHMQKQMSDFFETVTKELLGANNSFEATLTEIKTINDVVLNLSVDTRREMERFSSNLISVSEDLRRGLEEVKRDMKAKGEVLNGSWTDWTAWEQCSATCGVGLQRRERTCTNPEPKAGGKYCVGESSEYRMCNATECNPALNGGWTSWAAWGQCSETCGTGLQIRGRTCSNPEPKYGGKYCDGVSSEYRVCTPAECPPLNGGWTSWAAWGQCSETCGTGLQIRGRTCSYPEPKYGGKYCDGVSSESQVCTPAECPPLNGGWTSWAAWGQCTGTCVMGLQIRGRTCSNPEPKYGGDYCGGVPSESQACTPAKCPIMSDCLELRKAGNRISGVYTIRLRKSKKTVEVYCDMDTDGGGWTVFQNRFNGSVDFYRSFVEYESGFGRLGGEFWLGLSYVQELTDRASGASELRLDVSAADGDDVYEVYPNFYLSGGNNYTLNIGPCKGTTCDFRGLSYNRGESFSTYDRDVDSDSQENCAFACHGGWWYSYCTLVNLNGRYATPGQDSWPSGMLFFSFKRRQSLKTSKMMFRRTS